MSAIIPVSQNILQSALDILFKWLLFLFKWLLFVLLKPVLKRKQVRIEQVLREDARQDGPVAKECLTILKVASITDSLGVDVNNSFEKFFLPIPEDLKAELKQPEYKFKENEPFSDESRQYQKLLNFLEANYSYSTEEARRLILDETRLVASAFLADLKAGKQKSNNLMFGADGIEEGEKGLVLNLFKTDYFTFKCVNGLYSFLKRQYPDNPALNVTSVEDVSRISPFLCNIGVGGFLSLDHAGNELYFIGKRSSAVACPNMWQTSFDETFDVRDRDNMQDAKCDLNICLVRGIKEELGFIATAHGFKIETSLLSVIQTDARLELEIFIHGHCLLKSRREFKEVLLRMYSASDFENENEIVKLLPLEEVGPFYASLASKGESHTEESAVLWSILMKVRSSQNALHKFSKRIETKHFRRSFRALLHR